MNIIAFSQVDVQNLSESLLKGNVLVYPTETCYGLGCDATNVEAVNRIFQIKKRKEDKPMLVIFESVESAKQWVKWNDTLESLAQKYWPGALTVVAHILPEATIAKNLIGADGTIAFRVSSHPFVRELTKKLSRPLVSTSANIAGEPNPYTVSAVIQAFETESYQPDIVIDAGELPFAPPSTIVQVNEKNEIQILRQGKVEIHT